MKPQLNGQNGMMMQEIKFLRQQVADLKKAVPGEREATQGPIVEVKPDVKTRMLLLELLVAAENYFGPEQGQSRPKPSKELRAAMEAADKAVRKVQKPVRQAAPAAPEASAQ